jgi:SAM-dependent methyltransferase
MANDWNQAYEAGETPWDKGYASPQLCEFLAARSIRGRVLVPGCGTGHDVRRLAAQGAEVVGLDIAESALRRAEAHPKAADERYLLGDFLRPPPSLLAAFDWVFEHTCLCALDPAERSAYADSVAAVVRPGGHFLAVFFREVENYTGEGPPHPIGGEAIDRLFRNHFELLDASVPSQSYPSRPYGAEELRLMRRRSRP